MSTPGRIQDQGRLDELARMLARVFDEDPHFNWLVRQDGRRQEALFRLFQLLLGGMLDNEGEVHLSEDGKAVAICYPPGKGRLRPRRQLAFLIEYLPISGWPALPRRLIGLLLMEFNRPREPHYFIQVLGVDERAQGQGHGRRLVESLLRHCDANHLPVYLETGNPDNLCFYEKFGFQIKGNYKLMGGLRLWKLLRQPERAVGPCNREQPDSQ